MASVEEMDKVISRHYSYYNQPYNGQFATYCQDNGFDSDLLVDELLDSDTDLIDFDDEFPIPTDIAEVDKASYILDQLKLFHST